MAWLKVGFMSISDSLLGMMVCPVTKTPLEYDSESEELVSIEAGLAFPVRGGIPVMLVDEARKLMGNDKPEHSD